MAPEADNIAASGSRRDDKSKRAAVRAALGIAPRPVPGRLTKAQRRAAAWADLLRRWAADTRTPEQQLAAAGIDLNAGPDIDVDAFLAYQRQEREQA